MQMRGPINKGARSHPCAFLIRFTEEERKKLKTMLRRRRVTMQAFAHAAMMRALNETDLGKKAAGEVDRDDERESQRHHEQPAGLGIRDRLRESRDDEDDDFDRRSTPSTVVTASAPVLAQSRTIDDEVLALARTVVESPKSVRADVLRAACRALVKGRSEEDSLRLAEDLDAAIKRIEGVPQTALERVRARISR